MSDSQKKKIKARFAMCEGELKCLINALNEAKCYVAAETVLTSLNALQSADRTNDLLNQGR